MKIVVCVTQVGAAGDEIEFADDGRSVDPDYLDESLNEWDANAVEEALQLRDQASGDVIAVTVGSDESEPVLRRALAMGADRAVRIDAPDDHDPIAVAGLLADALRAENADLILAGVQTSDGANGATGSALAAFLDVPSVAVVKKIELTGSDVVAHRELEGGVIAACGLSLPAVLTIQTGINEPRYATFRAIKQADEKQLDVVPAGDARRGADLAELRTPEVESRAEMLPASPKDAAARIVELVKGGLA